MNSKLVLTICVVILSSLPLKAQYIGDQIVGLAGLQAGSQPAPGIYVVLPLFFRQNNIGLYDAQGNQVLKNLTAGLDAIIVPAVQVVTPFKILGANYGASYMQFITNGRVNVAAVNFSRSTAWGFGDIYVQPLILGWHKPRYDITAGYSFFAPTGAGSAGQHMWIKRSTSE